MHRLSTSFVLGYHGCSAATARLVLSGKPFVPSTNDYDWLGEGIYFWEANPLRGLQFFRENQKRKGLSTKSGTVVGAVIDLGSCLDLQSSAGVEAVKMAFTDLKEIAGKAGVPLPRNVGGSDLAARKLDCAVVNHLHASLKTGALNLGDFDGFDTVRAVFQEGGEAFEGSGFLARTHIQIAVRNSDCIKGVFRVREDDLREG